MISPSDLVKTILAIAVLAIGLAFGGAVADDRKEGTHTIDEKRGMMADTLGKIDRVVEGCEQLMANASAIEFALAGLAVTRTELVETFAERYQAGYAGMDRIFKLQDKKIVCDAAREVFGPQGSLHQGLLIAK